MYDSLVVFNVHNVYTVNAVQTALHCFNSSIFACHNVREGKNANGKG